MSRSPETARPPDLRIGPFALWIFGYEHTESADYDDACWLRVTAHCGAAGTSVDVSGSILMTADLEHLQRELERMHTARTGSASLEPLEPGLAVHLTATTHDRIDGVVEITPDPATQTHSFRFTLDTSVLPGIIAQLRTIRETWQRA